MWKNCTAETRAEGPLCHNLLIKPLCLAIRDINIRRTDIQQLAIPYIANTRYQK